MAEDSSPALEVVQRALAAQGLTAADVEVNRGGRVSPAQLERLAAMQRAGRLAVSLSLGTVVVGSVGAALFDYHRHGRASIFIVPAIGIAFALAIYFLVYRRYRLPLPAELAEAPVTVLRARVGGSLVTPSRGIYLVSLDGVRYSGCARALTEEIGAKGRTVDAYVIAPRKLAVALVPAD
ncbi:MAG TPA: hypothetical protein VHE35_11785 [Kofleriaceae bacterium]|nr:hypothetical protein [Kofleriaceae bacterium]